MPRQKKYGHAEAVFGPSDPSSYMLGLPKSRAKLGNWGVVAVLAGTILALMVLVLESYPF